MLGKSPVTVPYGGFSLRHIVHNIATEWPLAAAMSTWWGRCWSEEHAAARRKTNLDSHVQMAELLAVKLYTGFWFRAKVQRLGATTWTAAPFNHSRPPQICSYKIRTAWTQALISEHVFIYACVYIFFFITIAHKLTALNLSAAARRVYGLCVCN